MKKTLTIFAVLAISLTLGAQAQKLEKPDAAKQASADPALWQAFERTIYGLKDSGHGVWRGANDAQRLSIEFDARETRLNHPLGSIGFHLADYGYGKKLKAPAAAILAGDGQRLEYRRGDLTEWYVNGRQGLEQGFTFLRRPAEETANAPLEMVLDVSGNLTLGEEAGAIQLKSGKTVALRYAGLRAIDARGRTLPAQMEAHNNKIVITVDDRSAQYPLTVDPTWGQQQELTGTSGAANDNFGYSVAVSGTIAVIGAPQANSASGPGEAYVFVQSGNTWTQQAKLTASDGIAGNAFGYSVAVSGITAIIGAPIWGSSGAAYVFVQQNGSSWLQKQTLTAPDSQYGLEFGASVAMSGTTAIIGDPQWENAVETIQGAAYIFVQNGTSWDFQQELTASDGTLTDNFGTSVAMSGTTAVIGNSWHTVNGQLDQGAAYVFLKGTSTWTQQYEATASHGAANDYFGSSVAVSGTTAVIGTPQLNPSNGPGAAYVFVQSDGTWGQQAELTASDGAAGDLFGFSVAVNGTTALVGAPYHKVGSNAKQGAAYPFVQNDSTWTQQADLTATDGVASDLFGTSVAMNGSTVMIGSQDHKVGNNSGQGSAYIFVPTASLAIAATHSSPIFQAGPGILTLTVTNSNGAALFGAATVSDTINSAFTIDSVSSGCTHSLQVVTCTVANGSTAASTVFEVYVTASPTAAASITNTATLTDSSDNITTASSGDTIPVSTIEPLGDTKLQQQTLSGSTNNGSCASGNRTLTATVQLKNTSTNTLNNPYAANVTLSGGNTLISQSVNATSVAPGDPVTFTFDIQLASCNKFTLYFDVLSD